MGEAHRHPELLMILSAQLCTHPLPIAGGAPDVDPPPHQRLRQHCSGPACPGVPGVAGNENPEHTAEGARLLSCRI